MKGLSDWSKKVKIEMIKKDMEIPELAAQIGKTREFTSSVINGRVYSAPTVKLIGDVLNLPDTKDTLRKR